MERSRVRGTDAMDDARLDPATAARVQEIRGQCSLRVAGVHGSLAGRTGRSVRAAYLEPGGGHAVLLLSDGALERWDLDAVERVGRWEFPPPPGAPEPRLRRPGAIGRIRHQPRGSALARGRSGRGVAR
jgi:hypothetical protein